MDFPLTHVLRDIMDQGIKRIIVSYDVACKYNIHFKSRIANRAWPLMTREERRKLDELNLVWLVPKFHLAVHIDNCADQYSFNFTKNVGRTSGEIIETNWPNLNALALSTREMGWGHRWDTIMDAMNFWNYKKATGEGTFEG